MKKFNQLVLEGAKYLNKTQLYLLSIPYAMYQNYGQYKEDWESLNEDDLNDVKDTQKYLDSMTALLESDELTGVDINDLAMYIEDNNDELYKEIKDFVL